MKLLYDDGGGGGGGDRIRWCDTLLTRESSVRVIQIATATHPTISTALFRCS